MSKFNEELVKVEAQGFESKGSTEVKTVLMFKDDQHILVYNTIEDYYQATAKAVRKVGFSAIILALMIGVFSQFNSIIEVIGLVVFLFGICICLLSLAPRSIAKQIQKQNIR